MRLVDYKKFLKFRKKLDLRITAYYSGILTIIFYMIILLGSFTSEEPLLDLFIGLVFSALVFFIMGATIFFTRSLVNNGVERKRTHEQLDGKVLDVLFEGEHGIIIINEKQIEYKTLTAFSFNKQVINEINENLFISVGKLKYSKLNSIKFGSVEKCHITIRQMPQGAFRRFYFYNIDGIYDEIFELIKSINKFELEDYE